MTSQTQSAIHELADRFVHREKGRRIADENTAQRLLVSFEAMLRKQLLEHKSRAPDHRTALDVPYPLDDSSRHVTTSHSNLDMGRIYPPEHADLTYVNQFFDTGDGGYSEISPLSEKTSTFRSRLGEVIFRTVSMYYTSAAEIAGASLPLSIGSC